MMRYSVYKYKKGIQKEKSIQDVAFIAALVFFTAFSFLIGAKFLNKINSVVQNDEIQTSAVGKQAVGDYYATYTESGDIAILLLLLGSFMISIITSFFVNTNPLFFIISVIVWIFVISLAVPNMANVYLYAAEAEGFEEVRGDFPMTYFIMNNYVLVVGILSLFIFLAMYTKRGEGI